MSEDVKGVPMGQVIRIERLRPVGRYQDMQTFSLLRLSSPCQYTCRHLATYHLSWRNTLAPASFPI